MKQIKVFLGIYFEVIARRTENHKSLINRDSVGDVERMKEISIIVGRNNCDFYSKMKQLKND